MFYLVGFLLYHQHYALTSSVVWAVYSVGMSSNLSADSTALLTLRQIWLVLYKENNFRVPPVL